MALTLTSTHLHIDDSLVGDLNTLKGTQLQPPPLSLPGWTENLQREQMLFQNEEGTDLHHLVWALMVNLRMNMENPPYSTYNFSSFSKQNQEAKLDPTLNFSMKTDQGCYLEK